MLAVATAGARISMHDSSGARLAQAPCRSAAIAMAWSPLRCAPSYGFNHSLLELSACCPVL